MPTAAFITFGCKVNQYETEAIREQVLALGYEEVDASDRADVYVVNTCSVTAEGFAKSRRAVQRAARRSPEARILVVGCSTPEERRSLASIPQVRVAAGNESKRRVAGLLEGAWPPGGGEAPGGDAPDVADAGPWSVGIDRFHERTRACVKVQDGCNAFCSFCIVPYLRGRSTSRPPALVVDEVRRLVDSGHREIVISGVRVQDWGRDLGGGAALPALVRAVADVPGVLRVRLSSLGAGAFTPELIDALAHPRVCPHWHIPLQSGSDRILERMRRDYRSADFREVVERLRARFELPSISTDAIVGFPGETERDFESTIAVARESGFSKIHVFPYSRREGTKAASLDGHLPPREVRRRAAALGALEAELALAYKRSFLGRVVEVLAEGRARPAPASDGRPRGARDLEGYTERYVRVRFPEPEAGALEAFRGTLQAVRLREADPAVARGDWEGAVGSA